MQAKSAERTLRDLFAELEAGGQTDLAAGVYLAARRLSLPTTAWHPSADVVKATFPKCTRCGQRRNAAYHVCPPIKTYTSSVGIVTIPED